MGNDTRIMNAPQTIIEGTRYTIEIRNGWHIVRNHRGQLVGKRLDMAHAVALAIRDDRPDA